MKQVKIYLGHPRREMGIRRNLKYFKIHDDYDPEYLYNDIALLRTERIEFTGKKKNILKNIIV